MSGSAALPEPVPTRFLTRSMTSFLLSGFLLTRVDGTHLDSIEARIFSFPGDSSDLKMAA